VAQFSVFRSPGRNAAIPFVVQVQSNRLAQSLGRVMVPLVLCGPGSPKDHALTPHMTVRDDLVYANPLDIVTVPASRLGAPIEILQEADQDRILRAVDEMLSRALPLWHCSSAGMSYSVSESSK